MAKAEITSSELKNEAVESCMVEAIKAIEFPKPEGGGHVEFEFSFHLEPAKHKKK